MSLGRRGKESLGGRNGVREAWMVRAREGERKRARKRGKRREQSCELVSEKAMEDEGASGGGAVRKRGKEGGKDGNGRSREGMDSSREERKCV